MLGSLVAVAIAMGPWVDQAYAQTAALADGGYKIGVVNRKEVFDRYEGQVEATKALEDERKKLEDQLQEMLTKLEKKLEDYKERLDSMTEEERTDFQENFQKEEREVQNTKDNWQEDLTSKTTREIRSLNKDIVDAIQKIGEDEGYYLILEADPDPRARNDVLYFATRINLTQKVIEHLNKQYKERQASAKKEGRAVTADSRN
jgi:Skp family chaperone for outer membrane proteins